SVGQVNPRILVLPDRSLRLFYDEVADTDRHDATGVEHRLVMARSKDGGLTWSKPEEVLTVHQYHPYTPTGGRFLALFDDAISSDGEGNIYVASTHNDSADTETRSRVELRTSCDGGRSWSEPETVASLRGFATLPTVAAASPWHVAVTWYDFASDDPN